MKLEEKYHNETDMKDIEEEKLLTEVLQNEKTTNRKEIWLDAPNR